MTKRLKWFFVCKLGTDNHIKIEGRFDTVETAARYMEAIEDGTCFIMEAWA